jgi:glycosyltransferase involved in cell wall biosynthesis/peptidoglycan/xylan/chitin deacetylase (PgdA/CDA1 family)
VSHPSPRVSVVIPAFNAEATLPRAIESLTAQTLTDWEAVIVDDGSSDDTLDRARRLASRDSRIVVLSQEHGGASSARNRGIGEARGTRLVFLDADDRLAPDHLAQLSEALAANPGAVACCDHARLRQDGATIAIESCADLPDRPFEVFARRSAAAIHCFMVRRDLVREVGGFDTTLRTCEDWDLWQRIARTGVRFVAVPATLAYYYKGPNSLSGRRRGMIADAIEVIARAHRADPRVRSALPRYANGSDGDDRDESVALFAVWCAAAEAAQGRDPSSVFESVPELPELGHRIDALCGSIHKGMTIGGQLLPADVAEAWPRTCARLSSVLARIENASTHHGLSYQVRRSIERRILTDAELPQPVVLTTMLGVRADLSQPFTALTLPPEIDAIYCRICAGTVPLGTIELPAFGAITANELAVEVIETIGWRTAVTRGALLRRLRFWTSLLAIAVRTAPALAGALVSRVGGQRRAIRRLVGDALRDTTRRTLMAVDQPRHDPASDSRAAQILTAERAVAFAGRTEAAAAGADQTRPDRNDTQPTDRKTYWEKTFEAPDPWAYESVYETQKYAQTLSLLDESPVEQAIELGCAEGIFTRLLAPRVQQLIAADISERALDRARTRCEASRNIEFRQIDFFDGAIPGGMDLIVCSEVLYFLPDKRRLLALAEKLANALAHNGRLLTAHAFLLTDDPTRTGFDWEQPFGAATISNAFLTAGLSLEKSIRTELYRIDLFRRSQSAEPVSPSVQMERFGSPLLPEVEKGIVWNGAVVRRADVASTDTVQVPVLLYHRVSDDGPASLADYRISPHVFEDQMRFLRRHGFHTVTSSDLERHRRERRPMRGRPVLITFDDGYRDFYDVAWPILRRFGFTAEVFLATDFIGGTANWDDGHGAPAPLMTWEEIRLAHTQGAHFGSHLATHKAATGLSSETLLREAARSRALLERRLGIEVRAVAPPFGACDERVARILQSCGFMQIFTTEPVAATIDRWSPTVPRMAVLAGDTLETFAARVGASAFEQDGTDAPLVTAIVPAFNAEKTIDATLKSVRAQTYRHLEILVVDDGSTDRTAALVDAHARDDARVRLIRQPNAGVASARNRGIVESRADFIAPIDSDDLWMPTKIEKQMAMMLSRGRRCGLVYTWQITIDEHGRVVSPRPKWEVEGYVLPRILYGNLVGGGSPALMRKQAVIEAGGYDASLHEQHAQGCEDFKLYLQIAERYDFAVIREYLTGYRELPDAMSMDLLQMVRSDELVGAYAERAHPHFTRLIRGGRIYFRETQVRRALRHGRFRTAVILLHGLVRSYPWRTFRFMVETPARAIRSVFRRGRAVSHNDESGIFIPFLPQVSDLVSGSRASGVPVREPPGSGLVA